MSCCYNLSMDRGTTDRDPDIPLQASERSYGSCCRSIHSNQLYSIYTCMYICVYAVYAVYALTIYHIHVYILYSILYICILYMSFNVLCTQQCIAWVPAPPGMHWRCTNATARPTITCLYLQIWFSTMHYSRIKPFACHCSRQLWLG